MSEEPRDDENQDDPDREPSVPGIAADIGPTEGDPTNDEAVDDDGLESGPTDDDGGFEFPGGDSERAAEQARSDAPMGDLADSLAERGSDEEPPEDVFSQEEVAEIDPDVVWERLEDDGDEPEPSLGPDPTISVVDAGSYCEQCPYFSEPPDVACTHEGTEIRELVDMERFRVVDCPKVAENERLERL